MRAVIYTETGDSSVLRLVDREVPEPGPGEVRVAVRVSGRQPDRLEGPPWRSVRFAEQVPNQDGAGVIDAVGPGVDPARVGERVWLWEAAWQRGRTAPRRSTWCCPSRQAVLLPPTPPSTSAPASASRS